MTAEAGADLDLATAWRMAGPEGIARLFHETYERLAPDHGYETRHESAVPWEDVPERNRGLMTATVVALTAALRDRAPICPSDANAPSRSPLDSDPTMGKTVNDVREDFEGDGLKHRCWSTHFRRVREAGDGLHVTTDCHPFQPAPAAPTVEALRDALLSEYADDQHAADLLLDRLIELEAAVRADERTRLP